MSTRIFLIRHGITRWNQEKKYCGFCDVRLSPEGKDQSALLYQRLKDEFLNWVYSSDRRRAIESARIIFKGKKIEQIPDLREMNFGCFERLTYEQVMLRFPKVYKKWLADPFSVQIPEAESLVAFRQRINQALEEIISLNPGRNIAVVCHGGPISIFINTILKKYDFWKYIPKSASLSIIECRNGKREIKLFNDTAHLS